MCECQSGLIFSVRSVNQKLIAMFNFVLTVIGSFVFAYKATEYSLQKPSFELVRQCQCVHVNITKMTEGLEDFTLHNWSMKKCSNDCVTISFKDKPGRFTV